MELRSKNFQSWRDLSVNLDGFTTIVGPSDVGKSAMFRMLKGVFRNDLAESKITTGQKECWISVKFDDNNVEMTRNKSGVTYKINDKEYSKLAGQTPEMIQSLGFSSIKLGNLELDPIFGSQFDSQFLLTASPGDLNAVFGAFSSTEKLDAGKKKIIVKIREIDSESKVLSDMIDESNTKVHQLDSAFQESAPLKARIVDIFALITNRYSETTALDRLLTQKDKIQRLADIRNDVYAILNADVIEKASNTYKAMEVIVDLWYAKTRLKLASGANEAIEQASILLDLNRNLIRGINNLDSILGTKQKPSTDSLVKNIQNAEQIRDQSRTKLTSLIAIEELEIANDEIDSLREEIEIEEENVSKAKASVMEIQGEINNALLEYIDCPKCGYLINVKEHIHV